VPDRLTMCAMPAWDVSFAHAPCPTRPYPVLVEDFELKEQNRDIIEFESKSLTNFKWLFDLVEEVVEDVVLRWPFPPYKRTPRQLPPLVHFPHRRPALKHLAVTTPLHKLAQAID
jgi:hypothetical protein